MLSNLLQQLEKYVIFLLTSYSKSLLRVMTSDLPGVWSSDAADGGLCGEAEVSEGMASHLLT